MNYQETLDYLFSQLPMFQRIGAAAYKADLKNTIALCKHLGHPEKKFRSIHIAGTNGKGSVSCMLAAILQEAGYKTALFTSPHLIDFRERIRINGNMIPETEVMHFVDEYGEKFKDVQPSFFEWTAALAFNYFAKEKVEIAVIETGMGGRLDSTNVLRPEVSVITNIGFDHMQFLGDTLEKIAIEKAGIIKENVPLIIGEVQEDIAHVFSEKVREKKTSCVFAPVIWNVIENNDTISEEINYLNIDVFQNKILKYKNLQLALNGDYQKKNILPVLQAISTLQQSGYNIDESAIRNGLINVKSITGIKGRWEQLKKLPLVIADTAHNKAGLTEVLSQIKKQRFEQLHFVLGLVNDKDISGILELLPKDAIYYFCRANIPRAMDTAELKHAAFIHGLRGSTFTTVKEAYNSALNNANKVDMIYIGGSTFVVAEVI